MIETGLDNFLKNLHKFKYRKVGLIANQTSITNKLQYSWDCFKERGLQLKRIFTPEHGLYGAEQDHVSISTQSNSDCEIISLYKDTFDTLIPEKKYLEDLDLFLFDVQDIGARYYTYVNTMAFFIKAIENMDIEMIILDRPNPLGGIIIEGPLLEDEYQSFVGVIPVPVRHGMTAGELALFYKHTEKIDCKLSVLKMEGWKRQMTFTDTHLPWVVPSPNMPTVDTAVVYPGMCLFEGLNVSEGRGTTTPFQNFGAPFIQAEEILLQLKSYTLDGVTFRPIKYKPTFHKFANKNIEGLFIHVTDTNSFKSFLTGVTLTKALYDLYPNDVAFLQEVYEFNATHPAFDLLTGSDNIRKMILSNKPIEEIQQSWAKDEEEFSKIKPDFHLYGGD